MSSKKVCTHSSLSQITLMTRRVQLRLDDEVEEILERLKQKYPIGACEMHLKEHCFFNQYSHWILDRPKLVVWAGQIVSPPLYIPATHVTASPLPLQKVARATFFTPPLLTPAFTNGKAKEIKATHTPTPAADPMPPFTSAPPNQFAFPNPGVQNPSPYPFAPPPAFPWTYPQSPFSGFYPGVQWPPMAPSFMPPFGAPYHHPQAYMPYSTIGPQPPQANGGGGPDWNPYA